MKRLLTIATLLCAGCNQPTTLRPIILPVDTSYTPTDKPIVGLPVELRERNYDGGSCVHAANVSLLRWQGRYELAEWWRANYSYGEYSDRLERRLDAAGLRYASTHTGDAAFLDWAIRTRRGAGLFFPKYHSVNLFHLDDKVAGIMDNNNVGEIKWIPREQFLREWRANDGGYAWALVYSPLPPLNPR